MIRLFSNQNSINTLNSVLCRGVRYYSSSSHPQGGEKLTSEMTKDMRKFQEYRTKHKYTPSNEEWVKILKQREKCGLPLHMNFEIVSLDDNEIHTQMKVHDHHMAPNGYVHAASLITLADTSCGFGCFTKLPFGSVGFTTIELKSNFLGTSKEGSILSCRAHPIHLGKSTHVWDAIITDTSTNQKLAFFRCSEMILYPKKGTKEE